MRKRERSTRVSFADSPTEKRHLLSCHAPSAAKQLWRRSSRSNAHPASSGAEKLSDSWHAQLALSGSAPHVLVGAEASSCEWRPQTSSEQSEEQMMVQMYQEAVQLGARVATGVLDALSSTGRMVLI